MSAEKDIENHLIAKLRELKYEYRDDITDRFALECNFREKFEELNRVTLSETEFQRLLEKITTADVFAAAKLLRDRDTIERDDGTPLNYTLVNIKD
jgi:type I restriction enzyme, R subunit